MLMLWVKGLHIAAIAVWIAGLVCLPGLYLRRARVGHDAAFHSLHATVRYLYVGIVSPAAFIAVGSGTALIFLQQAFAPWFQLKLAFVGVLVVLHILTGAVVIGLFRRGGEYSLSRGLVAMTAVITTAAAILVVVLAKPDLQGLLPQALSEPGALKRLVGDFNPFRR